MAHRRLCLERRLGRHKDLPARHAMSRMPRCSSSHFPELLGRVSNVASRQPWFEFLTIGAFSVDIARRKLCTERHALCPAPPEGAMNEDRHSNDQERKPKFAFLLQPEFPLNAFILATEALRIANQNS